MARAHATLRIDCGLRIGDPVSRCRSAMTPSADIALRFDVTERSEINPHSSIRDSQSIRNPHSALRNTLTGQTARALRIDLGFLGKGRYDALVVRDRLEWLRADG